MSELDDFLNDVIPRQIDAERAIHNGELEPRLEMWSRNDPVTVLGAWGPSDSGWEEVHRTFQWVASRLSNCTEYSFDILAAGASGDLAYTVGFERFTASTDGEPPTSVTLRATHVYRREDGEWKIVHRHADHAAPDQRQM